ncbi:13899_t:CDS:2, partial [Racocetra fulgida]
PNLVGLDMLCPIAMYRPKPRVSSPAWVQYQQDSQKLADQIKKKRPSIVVESDLSTETSLFKGTRINSKGEERPLEQYDLDVLKWDKVGIVPDIIDNTNTR